MATGPLIAIIGPTASGKTALALELATRYQGEIICADSRTVYAGMDIGTAKPTPTERASIPHHLLDMALPSERFTAADFQRHAVQAIDEIAVRGHVPIMVGGTGLYVDSVLYGYQFGRDREPVERAVLDALTVEQLQAICKKRNIPLPLNSRNKRHLVRTIELGGGNQQRSHRLRDNTLVIGLSIDRETLLSRIVLRAQEMFSNGVVKEATELAASYGWQSESMTASIYRVVRSMLAGEYDEAEAVRRCTRSDMRLARRQMTWFRRSRDIHWVSSRDDALAYVGDFLRREGRHYNGQKSDTILTDMKGDLAL